MSTGTGSVTITVNDQRQITYDPTEVTPDVDNNISMFLVSAGPNKSWEFMNTAETKPITIVNPNDFSWTLLENKTQLNVTDNEDDRDQIPTHAYTVHVVSSDGDRLDFDPIIRDRND